MTKDEKKHYGKVASLGCSLCRYLGYGETPPELHHIRSCLLYTSPSPRHGMGRKAFERKYGITEEELLEKTLELINEMDRYNSLLNWDRSN